MAALYGGSCALLSARPPKAALLDKCHIMYPKHEKQKTNILTPVTEQAVKYNTKVRYYRDDQIKISCFSKPIFNPHQVERVNKKPKTKESLLRYDPESDTMSYKFVEGKTIYDPFTKEIVPLSLWKDETKEVRSDSIKRAIDRAFEIGLANNFQYFITLTLDKEKIDRYDRKVISAKLRTWLNHRVSRNQMDYILFPEYHKLEEGQTERAIHFHGLISAVNLHLTDSTKRTESGQVIYNLDDWKYGFSTAIELDGRTAVVRYVTKYITKGNEKILGRFYLSGGKTLKREVPSEYLNLDYATFEGDEYHVPAAHMSVKYKTFSLGFSAEEERSDKTGSD